MLQQCKNFHVFILADNQRAISDQSTRIMCKAPPTWRHAITSIWSKIKLVRIDVTGMQDVSWPKGQCLFQKNRCAPHSQDPQPLTFKDSTTRNIRSRLMMSLQPRLYLQQTICFMLNRSPEQVLRLNFFPWFKVGCNVIPAPSRRTIISHAPRARLLYVFHIPFDVSLSVT